MKHGTTACGKALCVGDDLLFPQLWVSPPHSPITRTASGFPPRGGPPSPPEPASPSAVPAFASAFLVPIPVATTAKRQRLVDAFVITECYIALSAGPGPLKA